MAGESDSQFFFGEKQLLCNQSASFLSWTGMHS